MGTIQPTFSRIWVYLAGLSSCLEILKNAVLLIIRYWKLPKIQTGIFGLIRLKQDKARQGNILFWVLSGDDATSLPPPTPARSQALTMMPFDTLLQGHPWPGTCWYVLCLCGQIVSELFSGVMQPLF